MPGHGAEHTGQSGRLHLFCAEYEGWVLSGLSRFQIDLEIGNTDYLKVTRVLSTELFYTYMICPICPKITYVKVKKIQ
jgi:hypothetical protein